ncbi:hypothetical protein SLA2020_481230 [Shorea laevis]
MEIRVLRMKKVPQLASEHCLEAMDLCESVFRYWHCICQAKRQLDGQAISGEGSNGNRMVDCNKLPESNVRL